MEKRVLYLGVVPIPQLYAYTSSADLGIFLPTTNASNHRFSGAAVCKLNDYLACGVPFILSRFDDLVELADETGAGVAVHTEDVSTLGQEIRAILECGERRTLMSDNGYMKHRTKYNLEMQYAEVLQLITSLSE